MLLMYVEDIVLLMYVEDIVLLMYVENIRSVATRVRNFSNPYTLLSITSKHYRYYKWTSFKGSHVIPVIFKKLSLYPIILGLPMYNLASVTHHDVSS